MTGVITLLQTSQLRVLVCKYTAESEYIDWQNSTLNIFKMMTCFTLIQLKFK